MQNSNQNQTRQSTVIWLLNQTCITVLSTNQHSTLWWSDPKFVKKGAGLEFNMKPSIDQPSQYHVVRVQVGDVPF